jgi:hypothetical protein
MEAAGSFETLVYTKLRDVTSQTYVILELLCLSHMKKENVFSFYVAVEAYTLKPTSV